MNVGMALDIFQQEKVDFAVLEVGMGGRLDSTNIVDPELCVITNISMDHQAYLGNSRAQIAREKAGIIKKGIPVLIGESDEEVRPVFEEIAEERGAPLFFAESMDVPNWPMGLKGNYQEKNRRTFLASTQLYSSIEWKEDLLQKGLNEGVIENGLRGRWEILSKKPLTIADTGHNEAAVRLIIEQLQSTSKKSWRVVWGMVGDKDISAILKLLPKEWTYYWCSPNVPRGLDADQLAKKADSNGLNGKVQPDVNKALSSAQSLCGEDEGVFIGGSTFVVAEVL
jgi:dihydrofolate synthase/folylpolyglutamate synthase